MINYDKMLKRESKSIVGIIASMWYTLLKDREDRLAHNPNADTSFEIVGQDLFADSFLYRCIEQAYRIVDEKIMYQIYNADNLKVTIPTYDDYIFQEIEELNYLTAEAAEIVPGNKLMYRCIVAKTCNKDLVLMLIPNIFYAHYPV